MGNLHSLKLRTYQKRIVQVLAIDDLWDRAHNCHILLNQIIVMKMLIPTMPNCYLPVAISYVVPNIHSCLPIFPLIFQGRTNRNTPISLYFLAVVTPHSHTYSVIVP